MEFLKDLALPQAVEHYHLLLVVEGLIAIVILPYLGFLLGASALSYVYNRKGRSGDHPLYLRFAKDLIDTAVPNKALPTFLALIPGLTLVFISAQLMQSTEAISVGLAGYGFVLLLIAIVLLYTYKYTFQLGDILEEYEGLLKKDSRRAAALDEIEVYTRKNIASHFRAGRYGVALLTVALFLIVSSTGVTANPLNWIGISTVLDLFLSPDVLVRLLYFAALGLGVTGTGILFFFFAWGGGKTRIDDEYGQFVRRIGFRFSVVSLITQPVFIVLGLLLLPPESLSGMLYFLVGLSIVVLFIASHVLYAYGRNPKSRYPGIAFYAIVLACSLICVNDQLAIHNVTKSHAAILAYRHEQALESVKASLGIVTVSFTGEDIYNAKCSACHLFDQNKVGPAYQDVLPKYAGKKAQLIAFVLSPAKVDPAFPPMPNQGLKPAEADSIASYLLDKFLGPIPQAKGNTQ